MTLKSKICGVSDSKILNFIVKHNHPPQFIGFIVNYPKSKRYVDIKKLKELMKIEKKILSMLQSLSILTKIFWRKLMDYHSIIINFMIVILIK